MALIECPECEHKVSDKAQNCPNCGYPVAEKNSNSEYCLKKLVYDFQMEPGDEETLERQEREHSKKGDWPALLQVYEHVTLSNVPAPLRSQCHLKSGRIHRDQLNTPKEAIEHFQNAFKVDKSNVAALAEGREIYRGFGNWKMVAGLYELEYKQANMDAAREAEILLKLAHLYMYKLHDNKRGIQLLNYVLKLNPKNEEARNLLDRMRELGKDIGTTPQGVQWENHLRPRRAFENTGTIPQWVWWIIGIFVLFALGVVSDAVCSQKEKRYKIVPRTVPNINRTNTADPYHNCCVRCGPYNERCLKLCDKLFLNKQYFK